LRDFILQKRIQEQNTELIHLNFQLEELSNRDALTGIHNRRFFDKQVSDEWQTAHQQQKILSLAIMDIDDFKSYNDHYGHIKGDLVLQKVVHCIQEITKRPGDSFARFGGEEFVLILPNTDEAGALAVCHKIRAAVEAMNLDHVKSSSGKITISIGVCTITPDIDENFMTFIHHADLALYEAKKRGKNRVVSQLAFNKNTRA
jgi:two-component system chemotaxis family response regulator WspR